MAAHATVLVVARTVRVLVGHIVPPGLTHAELAAALRATQAVPVGQGCYRIVRPAVLRALDDALGVGLDQAWATGALINAYRRALPAAIRRALRAPGGRPA
jgi:hypothetical protein